MQMDPPPQNPRKRPRSPSPPPASESPFPFQSEDLPYQRVNEKYAYRQPKRMRKANITEGEVVEENPLGRSVLKREAKKAKKAARSAARFVRKEMEVV